MKRNRKFTSNFLCFYILFYTVPALSQVEPLGAYTTNIPIEVQPFHGIEPSIAIAYNSLRDNGILGVGWNISGFSNIQRKSRGKGIPNYDSKDVFYIDGMELIPCGEGGIPSPSCEYPASPQYKGYTTKIESFQRIAFDPNAGIGGAWYLWTKAGIKITYESRIYNSNIHGKYRVFSWDITHVEDLLGNSVDYRYWQDSANQSGIGEIYIDEILYNGVSIKFYYERRPDILTYGIGEDELVSIQNRLKNIDVQVGGVRARTYELKYITQFGNGESFLYQAQQFGTDAQLSPSGEVINANSILSFPPITFETDGVGGNYLGSYEHDGSNLGLPSIAGPLSPVLNGLAIPKPSYYYYYRKAYSNLGDFDGNGQDDWLQATFDLDLHAGESVSSHTKVLFTTVLSSKPAPMYIIDSLPWWFSGTIISKLAADIDGDGRTDIAFCVFSEKSVPGNDPWREPHVIHLVVAFSNGDGTYEWRGNFSELSFPPFIYNFKIPTSQATSWEFPSGDAGRSYFRSADVNGDGLFDIICSFTRANGEHFIGTALSKGDGTFDVKEVNAPFINGGETRRLTVGDSNRDGMDDVMFLDFTDCSNQPSNCFVKYELVTAISLGNGQYEIERQVTNWDKGDYTFFSADINGDGKYDLVLFKNIYGPLEIGSIKTAVREPDGHVSLTEQSMPSVLNAIPHILSIGDADGDGKCDLFILSVQLPGMPNCSGAFQNTHVNLHRVYSTGNGAFKLPSSWNDCQSSIELDLAWADILNNPVVLESADVNGDGTADCLIGVAKVGQDFTTVVEDLSPCSRIDTHNLEPIEVNGDGKKDWVHISNTHAGPYISTLVSSSTSYRENFMGPPHNTEGLTSLSNWKIMDVNADGLDDLVYLLYLNPTDGIQVSTWFSNGDGTWRYTSQNVFVGLDETFRNTPRWQPMDITGDGKVDLVYVDNNNNVNIKSLIAIGDGTWIEKQQEVFPIWTKTDALNWRPAEINGDGKMDLVYLEDVNGEIKVYSLLTKGDGTWRAAPSSPALFQKSTAIPGNELFDIRNWKIIDVNGDGMSDLVHITPSNRNPTQTSSLIIYTLFSQGNGGWVAKNSKPAGFFRGDMLNWHPANLNSDNNIDLIHTYVEPPGVAVSTLSSSFNGDWYLSSEVNLISNATRTRGRGLNSISFKVADIDGNGQDDLTLFDLSRYFSGMLMFSIMSFYPHDLINREHSVFGGTTYIEYKSSSQTVGKDAVYGTSRNCYLPVGLTFNTVSAIKVSDGRTSNLDKRTFEYNCARWSYIERRLLGCEEILMHRASVSNRPGSTTVSRFKITEECFVQPLWKGIYTTDGKWINKIFTSYIAPGGTPPYKNLIKDVNKIELNSQGIGMNVYTEYLFDKFGNIRDIFEHGNFLSPDDDRTTTITYNPSPYPYIVGSPWQIAISKGVPPGGVGIGTGVGNAYRLKYFCYDGDNGTDWYNCPGLPTKGLLTRIQDVDDRGLYNNSTFVYDPFGNLLAESNPRHFGNGYFYDQTYHHFPISSVNAVYHSTFTDWDFTIGRIKKITGPNNEIIILDNDVLGRMKTANVTNGPSSKFEYLNWGDPNLQRIRETVDDGSTDGLWKETYFDGLNRPYKIVTKGEIQGKNFAQNIDYSDATSMIHRQSNWYIPGYTTSFNEEFTYDPIGRPLKQIHPDGSFLHWIYGNDETRTWISSFDELGHEKTTYLDPYERIIQVQEKNNGQIINTRYTYNCVDEMLTITDGNSNVTTNKWNILGQKIEMNDPDMGDWFYKYDAAGNLVRQIDAKGDTIYFTYDGIDRIKTKKDRTKRIITWSYDQLGHGAGVGKLTSISEPPGIYLSRCPNDISEEHSYNIMGQVISDTKCIDGSSYTLKYGYDNLGRLKKIIYPDGEEVKYNYNTSGLLESIPPYVKQIKYDPDGKIKKTTYANGVTELFSYDEKRQWLTQNSIQFKRKDLYNVKYNYASSGLINSSISRTNKLNLTYTYDDLNRLTDVLGDIPQNFKYDNIGNILYNSEIGTYTYSSLKPHFLEQAGSLTLKPDKNGNLSSIFNNNTQQWKGVDWTADNKPAVISDYNNNYTYYSYDAWNDLVLRQRRNDFTRFYSPLLEYSSTKGLVKYYYAGTKLVAHNDNTGIYWHHQDRVGSTRLLTDQSGRDVTRYDYKPYGSSLGVTGSSNTDIQFSGHRNDTENELIDMKARYYDQLLGRFISPDPTIPDVYDPQSLNRYAYAYNNPILYGDPTGLEPADVGVEINLTPNANADFNMSFPNMEIYASTSREQHELRSIPEEHISHDQKVTILIEQYRNASRTDFEAWDRAREDYRSINLKGGDLILRDAEHFLLRYWLASTSDLGDYQWIVRPLPVSGFLADTPSWFKLPLNSYILMNVHDPWYNLLRENILERHFKISPTTQAMKDWESRGFDYGFCAVGRCGVRQKYLESFDNKEKYFNPSVLLGW